MKNIIFQSSDQQILLLDLNHDKFYGSILPVFMHRTAIFIDYLCSSKSISYPKKCVKFLLQAAQI